MPDAQDAPKGIEGFARRSRHKKLSVPEVLEHIKEGKRRAEEFRKGCQLSPEDRQRRCDI